MTERVLLITPSFFGYESEIVAELERQGFSVTTVDERPSNSSMGRALVRWSRRSLACIIDAYYREVLRRLGRHRFNLVIVIKAEAVPRWFLETVRAASPDSHWVYYTFDSVRNNPNCQGVLELFDVRFSFDTADIMSAEFGFSYLPLFYTPDFAALPRGSHLRKSIEWDISFVGTLHSDRYPLVAAICSGAISASTYFFVQARWYFAFAKYLTGDYRSVPWSAVSTRPMPRSEIAERFRASRAVLDIQRTGQDGLTMRTFEALASGAVLVTTNESIRSEPFYDPERVVVVGRDAVSLDAPRLHRQLGELPRPDTAPPSFEQYSLASWVSRLTSRELSPTSAAARLAHSPTVSGESRASR
jgi:hypothetical protein